VPNLDRKVDLAGRATKGCAWLYQVRERLIKRRVVLLWVFTFNPSNFNTRPTCTKGMR
jgi:hypothetical protein